MKHPNLDISAVKSRLRFDKRMLLYFVFIGFSSLMWFFNKLGDETNATIHYPVTFINLPMQKVVVNDLPDNLDLSVQGRGFDILRYKMGKMPEPVVINLSRLNHILAKESTMEFHLGTSALFEEIKSQLPANLALSMIQPDTIYFVFSNYSEKRVPVRPVLDLYFDSQCRRHSAHHFRGEVEPLWKFAVEESAKRNVDYFVFGHYHEAVDITLPTGSKFYIVKDWISGGMHYAVFNGSSFELRSLETPAE